jgi:competence transcription factor ComK
VDPRAYLYASIEEIMPLAGLEPQTVQPIASCDTEHDCIFEDVCCITTYETIWFHKLEQQFSNNTLMNCEQSLGVLRKIVTSAPINHNSFLSYRIIHKSLRDFRPLRYGSRDGHAEVEHVNRGGDTPKFLSYLTGSRYVHPW